MQPARRGTDKDKMYAAWLTQCIWEIQNN